MATAKKKAEDELALGVGKYYEKERNDLWGSQTRNAATGGVSPLIDISSLVTNRTTEPSAAEVTAASGETGTVGGNDSGGSIGANFGGGGSSYGYGLSDNGASREGGLGLGSLAASGVGAVAGAGAAYMGLPGASIIGSLAQSLAGTEGVNPNTLANAALSSLIGPVGSIAKGIGKVTGLYDLDYGNVLANITGQSNFYSTSKMNDLIQEHILASDDWSDLGNEAALSRGEKAAFITDTKSDTTNYDKDEAGLQQLIDSLTPAGTGPSNYDEAGLQALIDSIQNGTYEGSGSSGSSSSDSDSESYSNPASSYGGW